MKKYILFFLGIGIFCWAALVPPEGMSKVPALNVRIQYTQENGTAKIRLENLPVQKTEAPKAGPQAATSDADGSGDASAS
ncbi:MAG: hypothetical protein PHH13_04320 [Candidatus Peribacteraceae bacterium]|nr:hypothetical protein [Candidatus Peribacteraceae bacterium]